MDELTRMANAVLQPGFDGLTPPDWLRRSLADGLGGVLLWDRNVAGPAQLAELTRALRAENPAVLVAIDEEGGDVTRLESRTGSSWPGNAALGVADDVELTRAVATEIGRDLAAAGINLNYAPVADVNVNPNNPVIGVRSFGADPGRVAAHTAAFVTGLQSQGVAACAKHFPGHGGTTVDSHVGLPVLDDDAGDLAAALTPFRAAIDAGVRAVMSAHILLPAIDGVPATLSRRLLTGVLREELGYAGLVITDAIEMAAIKKTYGLEEGAVRAIAAGADAVCIGGWRDAEAVVARLRDAIAAAVRTGRLDEQRLAEAAARTLQVAAWAFGARDDDTTRTARDNGDTTRTARDDDDTTRTARDDDDMTRTARDNGDTMIKAGNDTTTRAGHDGETTPKADDGDTTIWAGDRTIGLIAARRALRITGALRPLPAAPHVIELSPAVNAQIGPDTRWGLTAALARELPATTGLRCAEPPGDPAALAAAAAGRPLVIAVRDAHRHPWIAAALGALLAARPDATVVEMGLPHGEPPPCAAYVATYGAAAVCALAAAEALTGTDR
ncbi:glycoside hydrolase family 3 protein [Dactylosporangium sp. CA-092794]|uniref:glycoside hydrolase family 3 protein n=1 Tax=Dactylosporangium sp. CA-092794 TaxID=3239929 RepID=UPI003D8DAE74